MKDYRAEVSQGLVRRLCDLAIKNDIEIEMFEGNLQDNYIIQNTDTISVGDIIPRKNIIIREKFLNEWTSGLEMIMTDNERLVDEYRNTFEQECQSI